MKYPSPAYAAHIWMSADKIALGMDGHTVHIDTRRKGWEKVLLAILYERDRAQRPLQISERGSPTQYQVEKGFKVQQVGRKRKSIDIEALFNEIEERIKNAHVPECLRPRS